MVGIRNVWDRIAGDADGQGLAEYALILALDLDRRDRRAHLPRRRTGKSTWGVGKSL